MIRRWTAVATAALVALAVVPAGPASAASGRCAPGTGVTVVVDYGPLGGGVVIGCDPDGAGKPAPQVISAAGFTLDYVQSQQGFVCRVDGQPASEDCQDTPPGNAYWGLFWSDADPASWVYSSEGVGSLDLPAGSSIGWRFQDGGSRENPSQPPTAAKPSPSPEPKPEPSKTPSPKPAEPSKTASPTPTVTPSQAAPSSADESAAAPGSATTPEGRDEKRGSGPDADKAEPPKDREGKSKDESAPARAKPESAEPSESPGVVALQPAADEPLAEEESSSGLTLAAGAAVLLLGAAAGVIAWRRRA